MYPTSEKWKELIYTNIQPVLNVYIDDVLIEPNYIFELKKGGDLFEDELILGSTPSQYIELQIHKSQFPENAKTIKVEYGILVDTEYEIIPIGIYNIDDYTDDDSLITIKASDNMIKFEFYYDGSELVNKTGFATLLEVAQDICLKAGVELRIYFFFK